METLKNRIVEGTEFQFDLVDLVVIGKGFLEENQLFIISLSYKQGLKQTISFFEKIERDEQYKIICDLHSKYYNL